MALTDEDRATLERRLLDPAVRRSPDLVSALLDEEFVANHGGARVSLSAGGDRRERVRRERLDAPPIIDSRVALG